MNNKQSFTLGFILCLILMGSSVFAITTYYLNIPLFIEKKPSNYIPDTIPVIIDGAWLGKLSTTDGNGITFAPLENNETVRKKEIIISNNQDSDIKLVWSKSNVPEGLALNMAWCINPYNPERTVWSEGNNLTVPSGQTISVFITVTDVGLADGNHNFSIRFVST